MGPSGSYEYFESRAEMLRERPDARLYYSLYGDHYAFSGDHLRIKGVRDRHLLGIFGRFEYVAMAKEQILLIYERVPFAILLTAPYDDLEDRLLKRPDLQLEEKEKRLQQIVEHIKNIENDSIISCADLIMADSNKDSIDENALLMKDFFRSKVEMLNSANSTIGETVYMN